MKDLIEALTIFAKYGNPTHPTVCEHDELYVLIDESLVSVEDKERLKALGFVPNNNGTFSSYRFGSA